ncbi:hypothetical protein INT43_002747 [Umbelopsis isabellina]|uniref:D-aminoacyl-tRNA deacylase n=1 Tax=Mortierella isabellina TaxID=91625 RepID=A0A8H7UPJ1_MORIS|nr:hypothetical protein INT43_002747 [Umbelopsis isabellina]
MLLMAPQGTKKLNQWLVFNFPLEFSRVMRAVLQRVARASVSVDDKVVSSIGKGVCVLVGIGVDDNEADIDYMVRKLLTLRVFEDGQVMWKKNVQDLDYELLCVSQFTLFAKTTKGIYKMNRQGYLGLFIEEVLMVEFKPGSKPDFHASMKTAEANEMYTKFLQKLGKAYKPEKIKDGVFGAMMMVDIVNEGPVTIELDSRKFSYDDRQ